MIVGVAKIPLSGVVAHFCSFGIPHVWPLSQKYPTPWIANFLLSHPVIAVPLLVAFFEPNMIAARQKTAKKGDKQSDFA
jgi:hypothetical protein